MTDGQQADYDAGFNRPFFCTDCGNVGYFDVPAVDYDEELDELIDDIRVDPRSFEDVIQNALSSKCFVEAISLIHNTIEAYLKYKLDEFLGNDKSKLKLLKGKMKLHYLHDYTGLCYIVGLIKKEIYEKILKFNEDRNKVIHELLTKGMQRSELKTIARSGREIQMILSPLNHNQEDIKRIMQEFDRLSE